MTITSPDGFSLKAEEERLTCINPQQQLPHVNQHTCPVSTAVSSWWTQEDCTELVPHRVSGDSWSLKIKTIQSQNHENLAKGTIERLKEVCESEIRSKAVGCYTDSSGLKKEGYAGHCQKQPSNPLRSLPMSTENIENGRIFSLLKDKINSWNKWWLKSSAKAKTNKPTNQSPTRKQSRTSLVVRGLRICLPMQGTLVRFLVQEDPTCRGATKPMHCDYRVAPACPTRESSRATMKNQHSQKWNFFRKKVL